MQFGVGMAVYCMLVTTPCNAHRKGDMFWLKYFPDPGKYGGLAQGKLEVKFAILPGIREVFLAEDICVIFGRFQNQKGASTF